MKTRSSRTLRFAPLSLLGLALSATVPGCLTRPIDPLDTRTTWTSHFKQLKSGVDKIDLLLMIDNSGSMADKQAILADAVPNLVKGLLNPPCVGDDNQPSAVQPESPTDACPAGSARFFEPIFDVHIGIVSSSLGGHGSSACPSTGTPPNPSNDDKGHLLSRLNASNPDAGKVDTYKGLGFLAWDPKQQLSPPGEAALDGTVAKLRDMVSGVGQIGCGYEASLESWYRFLVDPEPYGAIGLDANGNVAVAGSDDELLKERAAFLRPDSMVAIIMLTDENDCSTREELDYYKVNNTSSNFKMVKGRAICATDPNNRCCAPCDQTPTDCPVDDTCTDPYLEPKDDPVNLRCWNQKKRFGKDFLYPIDRYVTALRSPKVAKRNGELVDNPLYPADPDGKLNARTPATGLVFLAGIVGVPWEDIARQTADGKPDILNGLNADKKAVGGFMSAAELSARDATTHKSRWDVILGDPANNVLPDDPLMRESRTPREGVNPITGESIAPVSASSVDANSSNGHEWNTDTSMNAQGPMGDLQYACIFKLKETRDCGTNPNNCDCAEANASKNPLCQSDDGSYSTVQRRAKGYPGLRELAVLKGVEDQGIVASVCPIQVNDPSTRDYGYAPAIGAIIDRLKNKLSGPCLTRPLTPRDDGGVSCVIIEAKKSNGEACCSGKARIQVASDHAAALAEAKADISTAGADCFCEIEQLSGEDRNVCQHDTSVVPVSSGGEAVNGWCYVDEQRGNPALVESCSAGEKYKVRFVGAGQPASDAVTFITCAGGNG
ncbi:Hypothetical protein A7982_06975 [Minicystis rosea]|nr:Hypothetical protein A7982_06975 [Minicystis rosea]